MKHNIQSINKALLFMLVGGTIVGIVPVMAKMIHASAITIVLYRLLLPIPILVLLKNFSSSKKLVNCSRRDMTGMLIIGVLFALDISTFYISLNYTSVAIATLLSNCSPIFILSYKIITNRKLDSEIIWLALCFIGLFLLCGFSGNFSLRELYGAGIALISAVFFTLYILFINRIGSRQSSIDIMLFSSASGAVFLMILCLITKENISIASYQSLILIVTMAWVNQLFGQTLLTSAISKLPSSFAALSILIDPVVATIFAWIILKESLNTTEICGAIIILISILCAHINNIKKFKPNKGKEYACN